MLALQIYFPHHQSAKAECKERRHMKQNIPYLFFLINFSINAFAQSSSLWGTWEYGGKDYAGSVYSINENGDDYSIKYSFPSIIGEWPKGPLCKGDNDLYYGIADGGLHGGGVIFEFNPTSKGYKVLYNFNIDEGRFPQGGLIFHNNALYGVTYEGGKNRNGTIYSFDLNSKRIYILHNFYGKNEYSNIGTKTKMILYGNSLFGLIERGGKFDKGTLYELNLNDTTYNTRIDFDDNIGTYPLASLTVTSTGVLVGSTTKGYNSKDGKIFEYNPVSQKFKILLSFDKVEGNFLQSEMLIVNDSILIGVTSYGGNNGAGVIFEYNLNRNTYSPKFHFSKEKTGTISKGQLCKTVDNDIYGLLSEGGSYKCGTLFKYKFDTKELNIVLEFTKYQGYDFDNGLTILNKNIILGLSKSGGENSKYGNIFCFDLSKFQYNQLLNFQYSPHGKKPIGDLIYFKDFIYGVTQNGGKDDMGTIFRISKTTNDFEKLIDFADYKIENISGGLCLSSNGKMYGYAGNTSSKYLPQIFYYEPALNKIIKLLQFGNKEFNQNELSIREDNSQIIEKNKNGQAVIKYTDQPKDVDLSIREPEPDLVAYISKTPNSQYPFEIPIGTPLLVNNKLYGLFGINSSPKNGGIFCFDIVSRNLQIVEYFRSGTFGNLIYRNGHLLYTNHDGIIDSTSIKSINNFDQKKDRPSGHINLADDAFYYFPFTWDGLYRKSTKDSISKLIINFGIASTYFASRKIFMNDSEYSKKYDLAKLYIKTEAGELVEKDKYNAIITGSVLKGPLLYNSGVFYGTTRAGGQFGSGILFKLDTRTNSFIKLFDFPVRPSGYSDGLPSSLILIKE